VSRSTRLWLFGAGALGLAALLAWGFAGLPDFGDFDGHYGQLVSRIAVPERVASDIVSTLTFDIRGVDTLGEEFILFAAAVGVLTLLRLQRGDEEIPAEPRRRHPTAESRSLRSTVATLAAPMLVLGLYITTHGHLTPGGGFQGGVVLMAAFLLVYLAGARIALGRSAPVERMEFAEGTGAAGFALIGLGGLLFVTAFLENFLPLGNFGYLWSGGTIPFANLAVGFEVMGAILAIAAELLDQRLLGDAEE
jgi:multicomponent Na+:H+ antiporter subunit B